MTLHPAKDPQLSINDAAPEALHVAVIGAGKAGTAVARSLLDAGCRVSISASGDPARLELMIGFVTPGAEPKWTHDAVADADLVVLALPLHRLRRTCSPVPPS